MIDYFSFYIINPEERSKEIKTVENNPLDEIDKQPDIRYKQKQYYDEDFPAKIKYIQSKFYKEIYKIKSKENKEELNELIKESIAEFHDISRKILDTFTPEKEKIDIINKYL